MSVLFDMPMLARQVRCNYISHVPDRLIYPSTIWPGSRTLLWQLLHCYCFFFLNRNTTVWKLDQLNGHWFYSCTIGQKATIWIRKGKSKKRKLKYVPFFKTRSLWGHAFQATWRSFRSWDLTVVIIGIAVKIRRVLQFTMAKFITRCVVERSA